MRTATRKGLEPTIMGWHVPSMAGRSQAARNELYNWLSEVFGPDQAEYVMAHLPRFDPAEVATKSDLAELQSDHVDLPTELRGGLAAVNQRLDRLFQALLIGMFGTVTAMVGVIPRIA